MSDLRSLLQHLAARDAPSAKAPAPTRVLNYAVTVDLRKGTHTYDVDPTLLADAQANPDLYVAPDVVKVTFTPDRKPAPPPPERELTFGEYVAMYS